LDLVRIIIREGQDINEQSQDMQNTPLHIAAANAHYLIVKYLVESSANPIIVNKKGQTPLHLFSEKYSENAGGPITLNRPQRLGSAKMPMGHQKLHQASAIVSQGDSMAEKIKGIR
jgi:hypothetical protein